MHFRWKCFNLNPSIRFETEGEPIPVGFKNSFTWNDFINFDFKSNKKLVICHSATHKLLAGEDTIFKGIFGMVTKLFELKL